MAWVTSSADDAGEESKLGKGGHLHAAQLTHEAGHDSGAANFIVDDGGGRFPFELCHCFVGHL